MMAHRDQSHHASERADKTPLSPKSRSPALKAVEDVPTPQVALREYNVARVDKGKGRASSETLPTDRIGRGGKAAAVGARGAESLGEPKDRRTSGGEGSRGRSQTGGRNSEVIDLTGSDDEDEEPRAEPPAKATEPDSDSDSYGSIDELPLRPPPRAPATVAATAPSTTSGPRPSSSAVPFKRQSGDESLNEAPRPKALRFSSPVPAPSPHAEEADPSFSVSPARRPSDSPQPLPEPEIPKARTPALAYPTPTPIEDDPPPRLLLRHPDGKFELKAREPPRPPPDSVLYRPRGLGNLPQVSGHVDRILQDALAASPKPQTPAAAEPLASSSQATTAEIPRLSPNLHRKPTQFGAVQPPPSPTKETTFLHRRTSSAALLVPTFHSIPTSSPQRQPLATAPQPLTLAADSHSFSEDDERRAERLEYFEYPLPFHLLWIPHSDDPPPPELENIKEEARCKGYPERRKVVRRLRASAPSGAGEGEGEGGGERAQDDLEDAQKMDAVEGEIGVRPWAITGLAEMVVDEDGTEEWRGAPSLPTRKTATTALAERMKLLELEEGALAFGYEREVFLRR